MKLATTTADFYPYTKSQTYKIKHSSLCKTQICVYGEHPLLTKYPFI